MVTDCLPWSEMTAEWIRDATTIDMPIFGVCYGHQLMTHALGMCSRLSPKMAIVRISDDRFVACRRRIALTCTR
ncbi:glutamine amidotransferase-related protein [Paraburkholderia hospita]|uniref:glutamine amidotransferase-related protein n=1 Tax=Paraburkholderia hospita TaxID=169430 RepID=UPI0031345519